MGAVEINPYIHFHIVDTAVFDLGVFFGPVASLKLHEILMPALLACQKKAKKGV